MRNKQKVTVLVRGWEAKRRRWGYRRFASIEDYEEHITNTGDVFEKVTYEYE